MCIRDSYRTVPTKAHLLAILLETLTDRLGAEAAAIAGATDRSARERLLGLVELHLDAAVHMRDYFFVWSAFDQLPPQARTHFQRWNRRYERLWVDTVAASMDAGEYRRADPRAAARLLLGMCNWVSRWYRPDDGMSPEDIAAAARALLEPRD